MSAQTDRLFDDKSINIHYKTPTSRLLKMNTLNAFELGRIRRQFQVQELASRLQRSKSTKLAQQQQQQQQQQRLPNTCYWQTSGGPAAAAMMAPPPQRYRDPPAPISAARNYLHSPAADLETELDQLAGGVDLKRYQHALSAKQRRAQPEAWRRHQPRFGRALYDFLAKNEGELSLKSGDLVELLELLEGSKWARVEDCQSGLQGLVPLSYLDSDIGCALAKRDVSATRSSSRVSSRNVASPEPKAASSADAELADQLLPMSKGEPIALIRRLSGHLYEASNTRQATGLVWSNDLDIIKQPGGRRPSSARTRQTEVVAMEHKNSSELDDYELDDEDHDAAGRMNGPEEEEDEEIVRYLEQLRSICTDLEASKERHARLALTGREVPLLADSSSLSRRRRARSASGALDQRQQQQQGQQHDFHSMQRQQQQQHHHRVKDLQLTSVKRAAPAATCCCACCEEQMQRPATTGRSQPLDWGRPAPRSSSSPQIVSATERDNAHRTLPRLCRARYAYKPRQGDELELVPGDVLLVVQECDDGWFIGSSYTSKQMGTFPGNFVGPL